MRTDSDIFKNPVKSGQISRILDPRKYNETLRIIDDPELPTWSRNTATYDETTELITKHPEVEQLFFPEEIDNYPEDSFLVDGLVYKARLPNVLRSYQELVSYIKPELESSDIIVDIGVGTGTMGLFLLFNSNGRVIATDSGISSMLGVINYAKAGFETLVIPKGVNSNPFEFDNHRMIYTPWNFTKSPPKWLEGLADLVICDHSIVYTSDQEQFEKNLQHALDMFKPEQRTNGTLIVTQLNHNAPRDLLKRVVGMEIQKIHKRYNPKRGKGARMLKELHEASKVKDEFQKFQLRVDEVQNSIQEIGEMKVVELSDGIVLGYIIKPE
ncbi:MAG: hypothetical protein ACFFC7_20765 [Candidatus Hermodarchaeota archaeon]